MDTRQRGPNLALSELNQHVLSRFSSAAAVHQLKCVQPNVQQFIPGKTNCRDITKDRTNYKNSKTVQRHTETAFHSSILFIMVLTSSLALPSPAGSIQKFPPRRWSRPASSLLHRHWYPPSLKYPSSPLVPPSLKSCSQVSFVVDGPIQPPISSTSANTILFLGSTLGFQVSSSTLVCRSRSSFLSLLARSNITLD